MIGKSTRIDYDLLGQAVAGAVGSPSKGGTFQFTVSTTPTALGALEVKMVTIKADRSNTDAVYIGFDSDLNSSNGFALDPGESVDIVIDNLGKVYVVSQSTAQKIYVMWVG